MLFNAKVEEEWEWLIVLLVYLLDRDKTPKRQTLFSLKSGNDISGLAAAGFVDIEVGDEAHLLR